jgi:phosphohistidine phosphatase
MLLILMRHGIAEPREAAAPGADAERALTERGADRVRQAAAGLRALEVRPERIVSSPLLRALQTARIVAEVLGLPAEGIERSEALQPGAEPRRLFRELDGRAEAQLLCVGHAPHLDRALAVILGHPGGSATRLKKAGAACLELEACDPPRGMLRWLLEPAALRRLGR